MDKFDTIAKSAWEAILQAVKKMKTDGMTLDEIAKKLGVKNRALIGEWLNENRVAINAPFPIMLRYLEAIGLSVNDFMPTPVMKRIGTYAPVEIVIGDELVNIPVYNHAGAGYSSDFFSAVPDAILPVLKQYFADNIKAVKVIGDSMEPTIAKGSFIGVVPVQNIHLKEGGIYLVRDDDFGLVVKRIRKSTTGLMLYSDNTRYEPIPIKRDGTDDVIVGEVVWVWQMV